MLSKFVVMHPFVMEVKFLEELYALVQKTTDKNEGTAFLCHALDTLEANSLRGLYPIQKYRVKVKQMLRKLSCITVLVMPGVAPVYVSIGVLRASNYFRLGIVYQWLQDARENLRLQQSIPEDKGGSNARLE